MEFQEKFKFLNIQLIKRKNADALAEEDKQFVKLNVLDIENNPCSFMIFNKDIIKQILSNPFCSLADIVIAFDLVYLKDNWNVKVVSVNG